MLSHIFRSSDEMATVFENLTTRLRDRNDAVTREVNILQERADVLDERLTGMRSQNKEDLLKTESKIKQLNSELNTINAGLQKGSTRRSSTMS